MHATPAQPATKAARRRSTAAREVRGGRGPALRFVAVLAVLIAGFYALAGVPWFSDGVFPANLRLNAEISCRILRALGEDARRVDRTIVSPRFAMEVRRGCDALEPAAVFLAAVLAFPAHWRRRIVGAVVGIAALFALNIVRIVTLHYTGAYWPSAFETMHLEIWQTLYVIFAMALWMIWAWRSSAQIRAPALEQDRHAAA